MQIEGRQIDSQRPPYIVAELSGNHGGSLKRALEIVDAVADAGADALKLQTYTADTMTIDAGGDDFLISETASPWFGCRQYELYGEAHTPWELHADIFEQSRSRGLAAVSAPSDQKAIEKHVTLSRADETVDAKFSLEPAELAQLVAETRRAWEAVGNDHYGPTERERGSLRLKRSLYVVEDVERGERH